MKLLYGWIEQNECTFGVMKIEHELDPENGDFVDDEGEVFATGLREGRWFTSFATAKRKCLEEWKHELTVARIAIREISKQRKGSI